MKKILILFLPFSLLYYSAFSQENNKLDEEIDEIIENVILLESNELIELINELNKYQILIASVDFNNRTYFLGRDLGLDQYSFSPQLLYKNSNGIFAGVTGYFYNEFDPKWDLTVLTGGYGKSFGKQDNFTAELGYSRYIFSDSNSNDFENSIDLGLDLTNNKATIGTSLNTAYLFGDRTGFQSLASVYGDIKLIDLKTKKSGRISLQPELSFVFASENIDTSRIDNLGNIPFINRIVDSFEEFNLRNTQLQLPLVLENDNFQIEVGYNFNFPNAFDFENDIDNTSFFNLSFSYMITLK